MSVVAKISRSPSLTLTAVLIFFLIGIALGPLAAFVPSEFFLAFFLASVLCWALFRNPRRSILFFFFAVFLIGIGRFLQTIPPAGVPASQDFVGRTVRVEGTVSSEPSRRAKEVRVTIRNVTVADQPVRDHLLVSLPSFTDVFYGDNLVFVCELERPEPINGFRYDRLLESQGITALCRHAEHLDVRSGKSLTLIGAALRVKFFLVSRLQLVVPEPHATFLAGLVFGGSDALPTDLRGDFTRAGLSHILAASGFNVSLVTFFFLGWILQTPLGRRRGILLTAVLLAAYVVMAGATPAVLRAALMASVFLAGKIVRRKADMKNTLLLAIAIILFANPRLLLNDVGFQLSALATTALIYLSPVVEPWLAFFPKRFGIRTSVSASLSAILFTLPVIVWHFGTVSLIAPLANLFVLPFVPLLMAGTAMVIFIGMISIPVGIFTSLPIVGLSWLVLRFVQWFSAFPFAHVSVESTRSWSVVAAFAVVCVSVWLFRHPDTKNEDA